MCLARTRTLAYSCWLAAKHRTSNPRHPKFEEYGARGIRLHWRWHCFRNFLVDMGDRPSMDHCLGRIDHDGNYEPGNVEWELKESNNRDAGMRSHLSYTTGKRYSRRRT